MKRFIGLGMMVLALGFLGACAGIPGYGSGAGVPAPTYSDFVGEIQTVDTGRQQIELRTTDGQARVIGYDSRTRVLYRQQEYPVGALERGDFINVRTTQGTGSRPYVDLITVQQSVQDRRGVVVPPRARAYLAAESLADLAQRGRPAPARGHGGGHRPPARLVRVAPERDGNLPARRHGLPPVQRAHE